VVEFSVGKEKSLKKASMKKSSKTTGEASGMHLRQVQLAQHAHRNEPLKKVGILQDEVASLQIVDTGEMESSLKD